MTSPFEVASGRTFTVTLWSGSTVTTSDGGTVSRSSLAVVTRTCTRMGSVRLLVTVTGN